MTTKKTIAKTVDDNFDIPFVDGFDFVETAKNLFKKNFLMKLAYSKSSAGMDLEPDETSSLNAFVFILMKQGLGNDGVKKLYEHFDGDDIKAVEWFMGKANRLAGSKSKG